MLIRAMLAEQIYRAKSIIDNHPYHRAWKIKKKLKIKKVV
jgi:hypothetical protein